jgi:glutaredoxin 3
MAKVEIYTSPWCGYCARAKSLLGKKGVAYEEFDVTADTGLRDVMVERAQGRTTVPQIFIAGRHVGGCDELYALERDGRLDPLLQQPA